MISFHWKEQPQHRWGFFIAKVTLRTIFFLIVTPKLSALDRLKKAANLVPIKKVVELSNGDRFEFYRTPLTMAERERAQKPAGDDVNAFALQLLVQKAMDENGQRLFQSGHIAELKNDVRDADLQALMLAVISDDVEDEVEVKK